VSANLDLLRSVYAAWVRGDWSSAEWAHPAIEFAIGDGPDPGSRRGIAAMGEGWRDFLASWEEYRVEAEEYRELDDDRVLVLINIRGRGKASGLDVGQMQAKAANLFHFHEGKVTRLVLYWSRERAFADLGLAPEAGSPD
jgi:hypothetical protein